MNQNLINYIKENNISNPKLHLGCGGQKWLDYINIDLYPYDDNIKDTSRNGCVADVFLDIRNLEMPVNSIDAIFASHILEHFTRWQTIKMVKNWYEILKSGGVLEIEMPDFNRCLIWLFHPIKKYRVMAKNQFYGNQWDELDYETHKYVWTAKEFKNELLKIGFNRVEAHHKTKTHKSFRDMHIEAYK